VAPFARLLRVPLVMDVDSSIPDQLRYSGFATRGPLLWLAEALERHALRHAAAAVTVCTSLTNGVKRRAPGVTVFQVEDPPLVDRRTPPAAEAVAGLRRELGLGDGPVILYSGNFEPYQGVELLLEATPQAQGAQFLFMGGRPPEVERLRARAGAIGTGSRVFFSGTRPPSELPVFLALADLLCSPRVKGENTPFKIYTYLASGKPIVATRIPTHTQLLDDSLAFLVEPSAEGVASGLRQALEQKGEARARAERGLALVDREYSVERYREKVGRAYAAIERAVGERR
jgi:glycosyltransferase involved in cell wall biosynthesis